ncbi:sensor histidine kinase [Plantactinospora sp. CA-290183]|uniref:sensor histidine kinase n=1 Tax=Plantactinospora sp. CA-290183 TaxID=3240006 RepID=UPI003D939415
MLITAGASRNLRHAEPSRITIEVEVGETAVRAGVVDDGRGFEPDSLAVSQGGGLPSMRERAELLRGRLDLDSRPGAGTRVRVLVPLGEERL